MAIIAKISINGPCPDFYCPAAMSGEAPGGIVEPEGMDPEGMDGSSVPPESGALSASG